MCHKSDFISFLQGIYYFPPFYSKQTEEQTDEVASLRGTAGQWPGWDPCPSLCATTHHLSHRRGCSSVQSGELSLGGRGLIVLNSEENGGAEEGSEPRPWRWLRDLGWLVALDILHLGGKTVVFTWLPWSKRYSLVQEQSSLHRGGTKRGFFSF